MNGAALSTATRRGHTLRALVGLTRISALEELQYRSHFWTYLVNALVELGIGILGLGFVFAQVNELNGWTRDSLYVVLGVYFMLGAVVMGIVHLSVTNMVADIRVGDFDHRLLKPVDTQLIAVAQRIDGWRILDFGLGLAVCCYGVVHGDADVSAAAVALSVPLFVVSSVIIGAFWILVSCLAFWTIQGEGIIWALDDTYMHLRWPLSVFPRGMRILLTTVFPAGIAITVPAQALTHQLTWHGVLTLVAVAVVLVVSARLLWHRALRRYEGASG